MSVVQRAYRVRFVPLGRIGKTDGIVRHHPGSAPGAPCSKAERTAIAGHLWRCPSSMNIVEAMQAAAAHLVER